MDCMKNYLIVPDVQADKGTWNYFYKVSLKDIVFGPKLMLHVFFKKILLLRKFNLFLYGSTEYTLNKLKSFILKEFTRINIMIYWSN